jgi:hypothetical protein
MPTLGEHLAASFGRPEIAEQLRQLGPPLSVVRTAHQNLFLGMVLVAGAIAQRVQEPIANILRNMGSTLSLQNCWPV